MFKPLWLVEKQESNTALENMENNIFQIFAVKYLLLYYHSSNQFRVILAILFSKVVIYICLYHRKKEKVNSIQSCLQGFEGDNMRVEPLGRDKDGCTYWYFYGSRLYKEDPPPKKEVSKEEKRYCDELIFGKICSLLKICLFKTLNQKIRL